MTSSGREAKPRTSWAGMLRQAAARATALVGDMTGPTLELQPKPRGVLPSALRGRVRVLHNKDGRTIYEARLRRALFAECVTAEKFHFQSDREVRRATNILICWRSATTMTDPVS